MTEYIYFFNIVAMFPRPVWGLLIYKGYYQISRIFVSLQTFIFGFRKETCIFISIKSVLIESRQVGYINKIVIGAHNYKKKNRLLLLDYIV